MTWKSISLRCGALLATCAVVGVPAHAEDDTEKVGLIAALGLQAADGKTTIGENGGVIEAGLLVSEAIDRAGGEIATLVRTKTGGAPVLVLGKSESANLIVVTMVRNRLAAMQTLLNGTHCPLDTKGGDEKGFGTESFFKSLKLAGSDPVAAVLTSTSYAPIPLSLDDRLLLNAVAARGGDGFVLPGEITALPNGSQVLASYDAMTTSANRLRRCADKEPVKSVVAAADALAASLDKSEGTAASALFAAAQLERLMPEGHGAAAPHVLRVAIEQQGGTAITRSNIWYTLGFPGAAKVSAGLIASYRLVDTGTGRIAAAGFVRCAARPMNIGAVAGVVTRAPDPNRQSAVACLPVASKP